MMFYSGEQFSSVEDLDEKYLKKINDLSIFKKEDNYKMYASFSHIFAG
jgi:Zn-dependent oligopeptidase